ncbi:MAG: glycosyltransferase, partial [Polyangiaceae bacterium]
AMLLVIGDGPERARLERQTREGRAAAHFLGKLTRPEALAHIAVADALVHTSEAEGLSSVIREADALGTRVVRK